MLCSVLIIKRALTIDGDNLSCFVNPKDYVSMVGQSWLLQLLWMIAMTYMYRRSTLERFVEQEDSSKK